VTRLQLISSFPILPGVISFAAPEDSGFVLPSMSGEGIPMYHAIWKLTALAVVVAVGVVVVIQAQRGMQEPDSGAPPEVAASSDGEGPLGNSKDEFDVAEPPFQGEPEMATANPGAGDVVPAAAKARPASRVAAIATDEESEGKEATDEELTARPAKSSAAGFDPLADLEAEIPPNPKRRADSESPSVDESEDPVSDLAEAEEKSDAALESKSKVFPRSSEKTGSAKKPGPVLMLDDPDEELDP